MTDDDDALLKRLAARERENRAAPGDDAPMSPEAEERIARAILGEGKPALRAVKGGWGRAAWIGGPLALAAAVALWMGTRGDAPGALPDYELAMVSVAASRNAPAPAARLEVTVDPDGDFELIARPRTPSPGVGVRTVLDGKPWAAPAEISRDGAIRITGPARALFGEVTGERQVTLIVAPAPELPDAQAAAGIARGDVAPSPHLRVLRARVTFAKR